MEEKNETVKKKRTAENMLQKQCLKKSSEESVSTQKRRERMHLLVKNTLKRVQNTSEISSFIKRPVLPKDALHFFTACRKHLGWSDFDAAISWSRLPLAKRVIFSELANQDLMRYNQQLRQIARIDAEKSLRIAVAERIQSVRDKGCYSVSITLMRAALVNFEQTLEAGTNGPERQYARVIETHFRNACNYFSSIPVQMFSEEDLVMLLNRLLENERIKSFLLKHAESSLTRMVRRILSSTFAFTQWLQLWICHLILKLPNLVLAILKSRDVIFFTSIEHRQVFIWTTDLSQYDRISEFESADYQRRQVMKCIKENFEERSCILMRQLEQKTRIPFDLWTHLLKRFLDWSLFNSDENA